LTPDHFDLNNGKNIDDTQNKELLKYLSAQGPIPEVLD